MPRPYRRAASVERHSLSFATTVDKNARFPTLQHVHFFFL
jgi:hypothetical protein